MNSETREFSRPLFLLGICNKFRCDRTEVRLLSCLVALTSQALLHLIWLQSRTFRYKPQYLFVF